MDTRPKILVVDNEEYIRELLASHLETLNYECRTAENGLEALQLLENEEFDLLVSDIIMPQMDGFELVRRIHQLKYPLPIVLISAVKNMDFVRAALREGVYDYVTKPFDFDEVEHTVERAIEHGRLIRENIHYQRNLERLVEQRTEDLRRALREVQLTYDGTLEALGAAIDLKDTATEGHCKRVTAMTRTIAEAMGIGGQELEQIARGAFLHDIGKLAIPDSILFKPGRLNADEIKIMKTHTELGYKMVVSIPFLRDAAEIVLSHHELFGGGGYPRKIIGKDIPIGARMFAISDTLDAITSDRPYRKAQSLDIAKSEIARFSGLQFDPEIVKVFFSLPDSTWDNLQYRSVAPKLSSPDERFDLIVNSFEPLSMRE